MLARVVDSLGVVLVGLSVGSQLGMLLQVVKRQLQLTVELLVGLDFPYLELPNHRQAVVPVAAQPVLLVPNRNRLLHSS